MWDVSVAAGVLCSIFFKLTIQFYAKHDDNKITLPLKTVLFQGIWMALLGAGVMDKYGYSDVSCFLLFLIWYLSVTAYIDAKIKMVYTSFNVFALCVGIVFLISSMGNGDTWNDMDIPSLFIWLAFLAVCRLFRLFGEGDFDVLAIVTVFFCSIPEIRQPVGGTLLFVVAGALTVQFIIHYREVDWRHFRLKNKEAFVPAIFVSVIINLFIQ